MGKITMTHNDLP